jgi:lysophospholipase L1-like esterase
MEIKNQKTDFLEKKKIERFLSQNSKESNILKPQEEVVFQKYEKKGKDQIICVGDSLTGWNIQDYLFGDEVFPVYPNYLQNLMPEKDVINKGFAGAVSEEGINRIEEYLPLFPKAKFYIIGFGTNDLASGNLIETNKSIINNLNKMVDMVLNNGKNLLLLNVPYVNSSYFSADIASELNRKRDYHNKKLEEAFSSRDLNIIDICSKLDDSHFADNLHTNENGAKIIAKEIYNILRLKL